MESFFLSPFFLTTLRKPYLLPGRALVGQRVVWSWCAINYSHYNMSAAPQLRSLTHCYEHFQGHPLSERFRSVNCLLQPTGLFHSSESDMYWVHFISQSIELGAVGLKMIFLLKGTQTLKLSCSLFLVSYSVLSIPPTEQHRGQPIVTTWTAK